MAYYGSYAGPSSYAQFRACLDYQVTSQGESQAYVQVRRWVEATGNFYGTSVHTTWYGDFTMYGAGTYADSGWVDVGWVTYGASTSQSAQAYYTGGSGTTYSSTASGSYSPSAPTWTPNAPTGVTNTRNSDTQNTVAWTNNATAARPYASLKVQRSVDGGSWADLKTGLGGSTASYADASTSANHRYQYRVVATNSAGSATSSASGTTYNTPAAPSGVSNTRNSDSKNTVSWTCNATSGVYSGHKVQRSVDGGSWADLATVAAGTNSYADASTSANHRYQYRVAAYNSTATSSYASSGTTYNTPAAPTIGSNVRASDTKNTVSWTANAASANISGYKVERSTDGGSWSQVGTAGSAATSYADSTTSANHCYKYRVRAYNSTANSAYSGESSTTYNTPSAPTGAKATRVSDSQATVSWTLGSASAALSGHKVERSTDGGSWSQVGTAGASATSYADSTTSANHRYQYRVRSYNSTANSAYATTGTTYNTPSAPSGVANTRNSDSKNTVSWTANAAAANVDGHAVERSANGGAWSQVGTAGSSATSWSDATTSADCYYKYRVRAYKGSLYSAYSGESGTTYNTPSAPSVTSVARTGDTDVVVGVSNGSTTATSLEAQRSADRSAATDLDPVSGKVTSFGDSPGGGTWYYRVRNARGSLKSAWSEWSDAVTTVCAPAAPTLRSPAPSEVVPTDAGGVSYAWAHEPLDGSAQTKAQLRTYIGGDLQETFDVSGDAQSLRRDGAYPVNAEVSWQVRTAGVTGEWGPWSDARSFRSYERPEASFAAPGEGFTMENSPLDIDVAYSDASGSLQSCELWATDASGATVWSRALAGESACTVARGEWLPDNGSTYTLRARLTSTSTLVAEASRELPVSFVAPVGTTLDVEYDASRCEVAVTVRADLDPDAEPLVGVDVWRVGADGSAVLLAEGLKDGASLTDPYAPHNAPYAYRAVSWAESGVYTQVDTGALLETDRFAALFDGGRAWAAWNPSCSVKLSRPERTRVRYAGRAWPVSYDSEAVEDARDYTFALESAEQAAAWRSLVLDGGGRGVWKSADGDVYRADFDDVSLSPSYGGAWGTLSLTVTRVDGGAL